MKFAMAKAFTGPQRIQMGFEELCKAAGKYRACVTSPTKLKSERLLFLQLLCCLQKTVLITWMT